MPLNQNAKTRQQRRGDIKGTRNCKFSSSSFGIHRTTSGASPRAYPSRKEHIPAGAASLIPANPVSPEIAGRPGEILQSTEPRRLYSFPRRGTRAYLRGEGTERASYISREFAVKSADSRKEIAGVRGGGFFFLSWWGWGAGVVYILVRRGIFRWLGGFGLVLDVERSFLHEIRTISSSLDICNTKEYVA